MLYERHGAAPDTARFEQVRLATPNMSARMDNLRATLLLTQLEGLEENVRRWNARYDACEDVLLSSSHIEPPKRPAQESKVGSSIQFRIPALDAEGCENFIALAASRGVEVKWFGAAEPRGFTSTHRSWRYATAQNLPRSDAVFATLFDMRLPLTFSVEECRTIGGILADCAHDMLG
ncbi:MAG: DegT/DnrJ/EryC1/StrS family aminotransferase [Pseudomonadota bacterium]